MNLDPFRLGLAGGVLWGFALAIVTVAGILLSYGLPFLSLISSIYPGHSVTYMGALIGLVYGFADGFIGLYVFGWLYNKLG